MQSIEIVTGELSFREHVVEGIEKYSAHTGEQVQDLAGRLLTTGLEGLLQVEGGLHGLVRFESPEKELFGSGPTSGSAKVPWKVNQEILDGYIKWCEAK